MEIRKIVLIGLLVFLGCSGKSDSVSGPDNDPEVEEVNLEIAFSTEETSFLPGDQVDISLSSKVQSQIYYAFTEGVDSLELYPNSAESQIDTLLWIVPELEVGEHILDITISGVDFNLGFTVNEYEVIEDPVEFVNQAAEDIGEKLDQILTGVDSQTSQLLQTAIEDLDNALESFSTLSGDQQKAVAYAIKKTLADSSSNFKQSLKINSTSNDDYCVDEAVKLVRERINLNASIKSAAVYGTAAAIAGGPVGAILLGFAIGELYSAVSDYIALQDQVLERCYAPFQRLLNEVSFKSNNNQNNYVFIHGEDRSFVVSEEYSLPEELKGLLGQAYGGLKSLLDYLPDEWVSALESEFENYSEQESLAGIEVLLPQNVDLYFDISGDVLTLRSEYQDEIQNEAVGFNFTIMDDGLSTQLESTLYPPFPQILGRSFAAGIGGLIEDTVQVEGVFELEMIGQPSNGTLEITNESAGSFRYQSNADFRGVDSVQVSAKNVTGQQTAWLYFYVNQNILSMNINGDNWTAYNFLYEEYESTIYTENGQFPGYSWSMTIYESGEHIYFGWERHSSPYQILPKVYSLVDTGEPFDNDVFTLSLTKAKVNPNIGRINGRACTDSGYMEVLRNDEIKIEGRFAFDTCIVIDGNLTSTVVERIRDGYFVRFK